MSLSDLMVRQAKAADTRYTLADSDGLGLEVNPASEFGRGGRTETASLPQSVSAHP